MAIGVVMGLELSQSYKEGINTGKFYNIVMTEEDSCDNWYYYSSPSENWFEYLY